MVLKRWHAGKNGLKTLTFVVCGKEGVQCDHDHQWSHNLSLQTVLEHLGVIECVMQAVRSDGPVCIVIGHRLLIVCWKVGRFCQFMTLEFTHRSLKLSSVFYVCKANSFVIACMWNWLIFCAGETGLGKSTLISNLFCKRDLYSDRTLPGIKKGIVYQLLMCSVCA